MTARPRLRTRLRRLIRKRDPRVTDLGVQLDRMMMLHEFVPTLDPEYCTRDYDWEWWYERPRSDSPFLVEFMAFQLALPRLGEPVSTLDITCYGTQHRMSYLREHGLARNSAGYSPYVYLGDVLGRAHIGNNVGTIDLTDRATWKRVLRDLENELEEIDPGIWDHLGQIVA